MYGLEGIYYGIYLTMNPLVEPIMRTNDLDLVHRNPNPELLYMCV
jgi:hypothetical protein